MLINEECQQMVENKAIEMVEAGLKVAILNKEVWGGLSIFIDHKQAYDLLAFKGSDNCEE